MGSMGQAADLPPWGLAAVFTQWQVEPLVLGPALLLAVVYLVAARSARRHGGWPWWRAASFLGGLAVAVFATHSGIGVYQGLLFTVHMVQHLLLIMVVPTLLALGQPLRVIGSARSPAGLARLTDRLARPVPATITSPLVAAGAYAAILAGTHLTALMGAIMTHPLVAVAEQWAYVLVGWLFFLHVFGDEPVRWRLSMPGRLLLLAVSMAVDTFVGVTLLQSSQPILMEAHPGWGSSPLLDTQTGGGLMWWAGDGLMALQALLLFGWWSQQPERVRRGTDSFYEKVRRSTFAAQTGYAGSVAADGTIHDPDNDSEPDFDDDEARHAAYNAWLARLDAHER